MLQAQRLWPKDQLHGSCLPASSQGPGSLLAMRMMQQIYWSCCWTITQTPRRPETMYWPSQWKASSKGQSHAEPRPLLLVSARQVLACR